MQTVRVKNLPPRPAALLAVWIVASVLAAPAAALELEIAGPAAARLGGDVVLELVVRNADGPLLVDGLRIEATGDAFTGEPYPLRVLTTARNAAGDAFPAGPVRLEWAATAPPDATPGEYSLALTVHARTAAGPATANWRGDVALDYGEEWNENRISAFIDEKGLGLFLLLVFGFGVLMSLSPCIYPMIPITLAVIGGQSQDKGVARGLVMSVTYVLGMAMVYALIGLVVATVFSGLIAFMQSPFVVGPIALLLIVLAFGMFGAFELQAPQSLRDKLQGPGGSNRSGLVGVFVMGMVAGLIASPCVGPFLNALLLVIATTGDWFVGFISLFVFGLGMGLLLIGVGTFPALMGKMPQSGGWMETVKKAMGLLLVAMAFWFVRPSIFLPAKIFYPLLGGTTILIGVFVGAFDPLPTGVHWWYRARKGLGIIVLVVGLYLLAGSLLAHGPLPGFAPQPATQAAGVTVAAETAAAPESAMETAAAPLPAKVSWEVVATGDGVQAFLDARQAEAKDAGRPMMIDFWATWCVYCKKLDKSVWNQPEVVAESQRFATIKIDATAPDDEEMAAIKARWGVAGLPRVVFIDSRGEYLAGRSVGFLPPDKMLEVMQGIR